MQDRPFGMWLRERARDQGLRHRDAAEALGVTRSRFTHMTAMPYATPYIAWMVETHLGIRVPAHLVRPRGR